MAFTWKLLTWKFLKEPTSLQLDPKLSTTRFGPSILFFLYYLGVVLATLELPSPNWLCDTVLCWGTQRLLVHAEVISVGCSSSPGQHLSTANHVLWLVNRANLLTSFFSGFFRMQPGPWLTAAHSRLSLWQFWCCGHQKWDTILGQLDPCLMWYGCFHQLQ